MNRFNSIFTSEFKQVFKDAIDAILSDDGLTVSCKFLYAGDKNQTQCDNCEFDPITRHSAGLYNGTGPRPFPNHGVCPVCLGHGVKYSDSSETLQIAAIFDSKYWLKTQTQAINITDGFVQTISKIETLPKIRNAQSVIFDTSIDPAYGSYNYQRAGDPAPVGFGSNDYIITMWKRA